MSPKGKPDAPRETKELEQAQEIERTVVEEVVTQIVEKLEQYSPEIQDAAVVQPVKKKTVLVEAGTIRKLRLEKKTREEAAQRQEEIERQEEEDLIAIRYILVNYA